MEVLKFRTTTPQRTIVDKEQVSKTNFYNLEVISERENE